MRKALLVALLFVFCGVYAVAQDDYHKLEVGAGWNYLHFDTGGGGTNVSENSTSGLFIDGTFYARKWIGLTADFEFNQKQFPTGTLATNAPVDTNLLGLMFGPRFKGHYGRVEPFGHGLFGFSRISVKPAVAGATNSSDTAFAMKFGGGVDVAVVKHFAVRVGEFNYYLTRFGTSDCFAGLNACGINGKGTQNNFTFSTGIVIR
jgi:opacity protein-like surface antigen